MSNGDMSNMDGKSDDRSTREAGERGPRRGKVLAELLQRLEEQKQSAHPSRRPTTRGAARGTVHGAHLHSSRPFSKNVGAPRRRIRMASVVLSVALVLVGAAIIAAYLIRPEKALPAPEGLLQTRIQMKGLEMAVRAYWARYNRMPEGSMSNILAVLSASNRDSQNPERIVFMKLRQPEYRFGKMVKSGDIDEQWNYLDGWGRPMHLEVRPETLSMRIRSSGPNGKDESGKGDDVEMLILANY